MALRLGVREQERGGVVSLLGPPLLFPVPGPKACVRVGGRLALRAGRGCECTGPAQYPLIVLR